MSTLSVPATVPSAADDCEQLHKAFSGWGTNEGAIVSILAHRDAAQRQIIRQTYTQAFGSELLKTLETELTRDFERALLLWMLEQGERDAVLAEEANRRWGPGDRTLVEIACARSSGELFAARQAYHARFKRSLEEDVAVHTKGDFRKLLVPLVSSYRYEGAEVDLALAKSEAKILHENISKKAYNDDDLIRILTTRSKAQLFATFNEYNNACGHPINKDLKADPKDEFLTMLRGIIKCITCPERYFEKVLRFAISKMGTDEGALTRVIISRAEVDMKVIKEVYHKRNSAPLDRAIAKDTRGDYEDFLLALVVNGGA